MQLPVLRRCAPKKLLPLSHLTKTPKNEEFTHLSVLNLTRTPMDELTLMHKINWYVAYKLCSVHDDDYVD